MQASSASSVKSFTATSSSSSAATAASLAISSNVRAPKTTTTNTARNASHPTAALPPDPNCEIEEISKKISEHADAIYRTWKSHGLAPTELLDFYTVAAEATGTTATTAAADFFGASKAVVADPEATSNEGLQKLVSTFVIKDKEQRSAKAKGTATQLNAEILPDTMLLTKNNKSANMKQAKPVTQRSSAIMLPETTLPATTTATKSKDVATAKKSPATVTTAKSTREPTTTTTVRKGAGAVKERTKEQTYLQQAAATTATKKKNNADATRKSVKDANDKDALELSVELEKELALNLDVNNLTQLQAENLLKIKELLQQESAAEKPKKTKIAASMKKSTTLNDGARERATATTTTTTAAPSTPSTTDNAKIANNNDVVADKNSNFIKKSPASTTATAIAANRKLNEQQQVANSNAYASQNQNQSQNKAKSDEKIIKSKVIKTSNSNNLINKSNTNNNINSKTLKENCVQNSTDLCIKNSSKLSSAPASATASITTTAATSTATTASVRATENVMEVARSTMPAPTKVKIARPLTNGQDKNLGRPILTRGSVAERVLMFEKCPDVRNSFLNIKRPDPADAPPKSLLKVKLHATPPAPSEQNLLQKEIRISGKNVYIPRFYFPHGKPQPQIAIERTLRGILSAFDSFPNNQVTKDELPRILKLCGLPFYWRMPVMVFCQHGQSGLVERQRFVEFWKQMNCYCHDNASRFVYILSRGQRFRTHILPEDMAPMVQDVVDTHPGLAFLKEATEFHSRYVHTVIARIFYSANRSWSGRMSISELKKSDLLEIITLLEEEDDINQIMAFFSYEHFYVIYCKFWELDRDHDLLINQDDLARHSDHALSTRIIERIFSGCVTRSDNRKNSDDEPKMSYTDFVWFLLSEEDKRTPTAIEYWFRCMDVDGDGVLSMYELEYFYEEQQQRMESIGIETLPFEDCLCQMLDMIKPQNQDCITLGDLKRCKMTHVFFDTFFNLEKYLDHEQRDPFASQRDEYSSDWDRFAAREYELLITEEND